MAEVRHGGFAIDVPDGWSDQSTLLFVGPLEPTSATSLESTRALPETIAIRFSMVGADDPRQLLIAQADQLADIDPDFEVTDEGSFDCPLGDGFQYTHRLSLDGVTMRQITVACAVGAVVIVATASAADERFDKKKAELIAILSSMRAGGDR